MKKLLMVLMIAMLSIGVGFGSAYSAAHKIDNGKCSFVENGELVVWVTEEGERFTVADFFVEYELLVEAWHKDKCRFFDKKTKKIVSWTLENGEKFSAFESSVTYGPGSLVRIMYKDQSRLHDRKSRKALSWRTSDGEEFSVVFWCYDNGSVVEIYHKNQLRFFDKKTRCEI